MHGTGVCMCRNRVSYHKGIMHSPSLFLNRTKSVSQFVRQFLTCISSSKSSYLPVGRPRSLMALHNSKSSMLVTSGMVESADSSTLIANSACGLGARRTGALSADKASCLAEPIVSLNDADKKTVSLCVFNGRT